MADPVMAPAAKPEMFGNGAEHKQFRGLVRHFLEREVADHIREWEEAGRVPREVWRRAGELGLLGFAAPVEYGGAGATDFYFNAILTDELARVGASSVGFRVHNDMVMTYLIKYGTEQQKRTWLPRMCAGETIGAIAITEPDAGSDIAGLRLRAKLTDADYHLHGQKLYISNGMEADLIVVAAKTSAEAGREGISLIVVEGSAARAIERSALKKIGMHSQDTASLSFDDVIVPKGNLLGAEGDGFEQLKSMLKGERMSVAVDAVSNARHALTETVAYCTQRRAFGRDLLDFQNTRFVLANVATEVAVGSAFVAQCIDELNANTLTVERAAMAKLWSTEMSARSVDVCLQAHGGFGYMQESMIGRRFVDGRAKRISAGSNEIMREVIGRSLRHGQVI